MSYDLKKYTPRPPSSSDKMNKREFTILDHFLRDGSVYQNARKGEATITNIPLLKQFLTDLFFLTYFWDPDEVPEPTVIVIGSGNGEYYLFLSELFPTATFYLYDQVEFVIDEESSDRVFFSNQPFVPGEFNSDTTYLISHIKSEDRAADMELQMEWMEELRPVKGMLRYDINYVNYYDGYAILPPWDKQSYELYLVPTNNLDRRDWNLKLLRKQLWYHYHIVREYHNYLNIFDDTWNVYDQDELINTRWDDTWTMSILRDYLIKMMGNADLDGAIQFLKMINVELSLNIGVAKTA